MHALYAEGLNNEMKVATMVRATAPIACTPRQVTPGPEMEALAPFV